MTPLPIWFALLVWLRGSRGLRPLVTDLATDSATVGPTMIGELLPVVGHRPPTELDPSAGAQDVLTRSLAVDQAVAALAQLHEDELVARVPAYLRVLPGKPLEAKVGAGGAPDRGHIREKLDYSLFVARPGSGSGSKDQARSATTLGVVRRGHRPPVSATEGRCERDQRGRRQRRLRQRRSSRAAAAHP